MKARNPPFVCNIADCTFLIHFKEDHEFHVFTCKSEQNLSWKEKVPLGSNLSYSAFLDSIKEEDTSEMLHCWLGTTPIH